MNSSNFGHQVAPLALVSVKTRSLYSMFRAIQLLEWPIPALLLLVTQMTGGDISETKRSEIRWCQINRCRFRKQIEDKKF